MTVADEIVFTMSPKWSRPDRIPRHLWPGVERTLERGGDQVVDLARRIVPIDEGDLVSTIRHELDHNATGPFLRILAGGLYGTGAGKFVDYARYVEEGTSRAPRQPFLVPALAQATRLGRF
jgi:hypothetical protein